jgi:hypothetical protein
MNKKDLTEADIRTRRPLFPAARATGGKLLAALVAELTAA